MLKVAILDDYQNVSQVFLNLKKLDGKYEFKIFNEAFVDEDDAGGQLKDYEALLIMRERTKITKSLIKRLTKLKFIITSGMRNKAIDLETAKQRKIIVCGTELNSNPTAELTWALILGLVRNFKEEIDNMYQGYWQTTVGFELKGKILGLIGLGKVGSQVAKIGKAFGMQVVAWSENLNLNHAKELEVIPMNKEDLIKIFEKTGLDKSKNPVFTCGSGVTASVLAMAFRLIHDNYSPTIYDGSWSEYGKIR